MLNDLPRLTRSTAFVMTPLANTDRHRRDGTAGTQEGCESLGPWLPWPKPSAEEWEWEWEGKYEVGTDYLAHHFARVLHGLWHKAVQQDSYSEGTPSSGDKSPVMPAMF